MFEAILKNATNICDAKFATLFRFNGETFFPASHIGAPAALVEAHNRGETTLMEPRNVEFTAFVAARNRSPPLGTFHV